MHVKDTENEKRWKKNYRISMPRPDFFMTFPPLSLLSFFERVFYYQFKRFPSETL